MRPSARIFKSVHQAALPGFALPPVFVPPLGGRVPLPPQIRFEIFRWDGFRCQYCGAVASDVELEVDGPVTRHSILDALEARYPMLRGTIRDHVAGQHRPLLRFFACGEDVTHEPADAPLPQAIASGAEPFYIIGAIAGGNNVSV